MILKYETTLADLDSTDRLAKKIANALMPGVVIYLYGVLGAGKTTLVRAILGALGHTGVTKSPTYTLVETYNINSLHVNHFDLYRLADPSELEFIGIRDYMNGISVCILEWPDKGSGYIPSADLEVTIQLYADCRKAVLVATSPNGVKILEAISGD